MMQRSLNFKKNQLDQISPTLVKNKKLSIGSRTFVKIQKPLWELYYFGTVSYSKKRRQQRQRIWEYYRILLSEILSVQLLHRSGTGYKYRWREMRKDDLRASKLAFYRNRIEKTQNFSQKL